MGFGELFKLNIMELLARLCHYVLENFDPISCSLNIGIKETELRVTPLESQLYIGLPLGTRRIRISRMSNYERIVIEFRRQFGVKVDPKTEKETVRDLGTIKPSDISTLLVKCEETDSWFKRNFLVLLTNMLFEGNPNRTINIKILDVLEDTRIISEMDWCIYMVDILIECTEAWKKTNNGYYKGPILLPLFIYVD